MKTAMVDARLDLTECVAAAIEILNRKDLVALPTETVYGLAGDALEPEAVAKIFEAKERPSFDPLIIHIENQQWLTRLTRSSERPIANRLVEKFWPGPLTILFPKSDLVPDLVTAGLEQVAIRMPSHPIFVEVLRAFGKPLAAPSANRFGRVSPTRAEHVLDELEGRIALILDAGPTEVGLESTVVRVNEDENRIEILRQGPVGEESLAEIAPTEETSGSPKIEAPGQTASHYAPDKLVHLFGPEAIGPDSHHDALICWGPIRHGEDFSAVRSLSETQDLRVAAQRLFGLLREVDRLDVRRIFIEPVPEVGLGKAIMDRVRRASAPR